MKNNSDHVHDCEVNTPAAPLMEYDAGGGGGGGRLADS